MADDSLTGQYSVVAPFLTAYVPSWLSGDTFNGLRIASYTFYEALYWNDAGGFKMTLRGDEEFPVYIPSARRIINTFNRYVARGMKPEITAQQDATALAAASAFDILFKRERFLSLFKQSKKMGLIRGDFILGLFADPLKAQGSRISIQDIHPSRYFPIPDPDNINQLTGQQLIEQVKIGDKFYIHVQSWYKSSNPVHPNYNPGVAESQPLPIAYEDVTYEQENFNDPLKRKTFSNPATDVALDTLDGIITLPLYHFGNDRASDAIYGTSELKGLERIFLAINQTGTDEDVAIAMAGLGLYKSDSTPVDVDGKITDWVLGPKRVVEIPRGGIFDRVSGVASVEPSQGHMNWLQGQAESVLGISDVALGQVDVSVAESGIALALRMGPLLDASDERDADITDILTQMFHDLKQWLLVYEKLNLGDDITGAVIMPVYGDKLPTDRSGEMDRLKQLFQDGVIPVQTYWAMLRKLGLELPTDQEMTKLFADAGDILDPTGARLAAEATGSGPVSAAVTPVN